MWKLTWNSPTTLTALLYIWKLSKTSQGFTTSNFIKNYHQKVMQLNNQQNFRHIKARKPYGVTNIFLSDNTKVTENDNESDTSDQLLNQISEAQLLKIQAQRARLEADKLEATLTLQKLTDLEKILKKTIADGEKRDDIKKQIELLAKKVDPSFRPRFLESGQQSPTSTVAKSEPSAGGVNEEETVNLYPALTPTELLEAYMAYSKLPVQMQITLAKAVGYDIRTNTISKDLTEEIIQKLNQQQAKLLSDPTKLQEIYQQSMKQSNIKKSFQMSKASVVDLSKAETDEELEEGIESILSEAGFDLSEVAKARRFMESSYPGQTRKAGEGPTEEDAQFFMYQVLDAKNVFNPTRNPEIVSGGYLIRGDSLMKEGEDLVGAIDKSFQKSKLAEKFNFFYVRDPTMEALEDMEDFFGKPVLLLMGKDMTPVTSPLLLSSVSSISLFLTFLYVLGTFASNDLIMNRLQEANAVGDYNIDWFNDLFTPLLIPILGIQAAHEVAHFIISKKDNFKMGPPTILPAITLPNFGCNTVIKTAPPTVTSMFDFGISGPLTGIIISTILLFAGVQMTTATTDAAIYSYFPSLSMDVLKISRLGGSIIDAALNGALTSTLNSDVSSIQLHPFALAGYVGLIVNALNLLPLGSTDGGRMSQAIFGRNGHSVIQGFVYLGMFGSSILGLDHTNILLGYGLFCVLAQSDLEIPCRDEIEPVPTPRIFIALGLWMFVGLTLLPL